MSTLVCQDRSLSIKEEAGTFLSLGGLYFNTGRTLVAKEMFSKALQMEPTRVDIICSYVSIIIFN